MYPTFRPLLFRLEPERAHALTLGLIRFAGSISPFRAILRKWFAGPDRQVRAFGLSFHNPVGLAAGYDKDGLAWRGLASLGFGHIEIGTVTPRPQDGNPRPRLFRLPDEQALINRLGFPGKGADYVAERLRGWRPEGLVLGVNLGVNKDTPMEDATIDYLELLKIFAPLADYLVVNVSSPNTVGLRRLQARQHLEGLLGALAEERRAQVDKLERHLPLLVKLAPELDEKELDDALDAIIETGMDGVIATNTTVGREGVRGSPWASQAGGLSGAPLRSRSTQMVARIYHRTGGKLPIIGVGGVMRAEDAREKLETGASLVQLYTGLVYRGPGLVKEILKGI
jgi:dihydroorotate dehydrogenase